MHALLLVLLAQPVGWTPVPLAEASAADGEPKAIPRKLAFRPGTHDLYAGLTDGALERWDADTMRSAARVPKAHAGGVTGLGFTRDALVTVGADGRLVLRDPATLAERGAGDVGGPVDDLAVGGDRALLSTGGPLQLWALDGAAPRKLAVFEGHKGRTCVAISHDGLLTSAGADGTMRTWNADGTPASTYAPKAKYVHACSAAAFNRTGYFYVGSAFAADAHIKSWLPPSWRPSFPVRHETFGVFDLVFVGDALLTANLRGAATLWPPGGAPPVVFPLGEAQGIAVAGSDDGRLIAVSATGKQKGLHVWRRK